MKNKKLKVLSIVLAVVLAALIITAIIVVIKVNGDGKFEKQEVTNPYGIKSEFVDSTNKEKRLSEYPEVKNQIVKLEEKILANNLKINKIQFDGYGLDAAYFLKDMGDRSNYIKLDMSKDSDSGEYKIISVESKIYDDSEYEASQKAILSYLEISDEEAKLVDNITEEDGIQTMKYYISYTNGKENVYTKTGESSESQEVTYKDLKITNHPAEDEKKTDLYKAKRNERKPKADGKNIDEYGLSFYIPNALKANSYNGTFYTWEFYTGEYVGNYPDGVDLVLKVRGLPEGKDADTYIRNDSRPAKSSGVSPFEIKELNGKSWYTCNNGTIFYYGAEFNGNLYEFEIKNGKEYDGITLQTVTDMLEKTLFFE